MYNKLKKIREENNISQAELASLLGYKHKSGYGKLENGDRKISLEQAKIISEYFNMTIEEIFFEN